MSKQETIAPVREKYSACKPLKNRRKGTWQGIPLQNFPKKWRICLVDMFYNTTFAPAIEKATMVVERERDDL